MLPLHPLTNSESATLLKLVRQPWQATETRDGWTLKSTPGITGHRIAGNLTSDQARLAAAAPRLLAAILGLADPNEVIRELLT